MKRRVGVCTLLALGWWVGGVRAQTVAPVATFNNIGISVWFPCPPAATTVIATAIAVAGGEYRPAHPLCRIASNQFAGSFFALTPDTEYTLRLSSPAFSSNLLLSVRTRSERFPPATNRTWHVDPAGHDSHDGLTTGTAFRTVARALSGLQSGDRVLLHRGRYYEGDLSVPVSGQPAAPITIEAASDGVAVLDGTDTNFVPAWVVYDAGHQIYRTVCAAQPANAYLNGEQFYHYQVLNDLISNRWGQTAGYHADGAHLYARFPGGGAPGTNQVAIPARTTGITLANVSHINLIGLEFCYYGAGDYHRGVYIDGGDSNRIERCYFHHNGVGVALKRAAHHNVIQYCLFNESPADAFAWSAVKDGDTDYEAGGFVVYGSNQSNVANVIRFNRFAHLFDGAHLYSDTASGPTMNMDFHDNLIEYCGDDGIETDGAGINVRIYRNTFHDFLTGISVAPAQYGPTYVMRNLLYAWHPTAGYEGYPFKFNVSSSMSIDWVHLYHNTCCSIVPNQDGFLFKGYSRWTNIVSRNNIYAGTDYALENWSTINPVDFDYDALHTTNTARFVYWAGTSYPTPAAFAAGTGQEVHGLAAEPRFREPATNDYRLRPDSPLIDRGIAIPGVNDDFVGPAPDIGAFEFAHAALAIGFAAGGVASAWETATGRSYRLEFSPAMGSGEWTAVAAAAQATGVVLWLTHTNRDHHFGGYRAVLEP